MLFKGDKWNGACEIKFSASTEMLCFSPGISSLRRNLGDCIRKRMMKVSSCIVLDVDRLTDCAPPDHHHEK